MEILYSKALRLDVTKVSLFIVFHSKAHSKLPKCRYYCVALPSCALEVTKVSLPSCSLPSCALEVTKVSVFIVFSMRPAASKLPKCRYFRVVPLPSCALDVLKVLLFTFFPPHCAVEVTKVAHAIQVTKVSLPSCSRPILRPRSYQSITIHCFSMRPAASKLPKCRYFRVPFLSCALYVRTCYYLPFFHPTAPSKLPKCRAPSKLPKGRHLRGPLPSCAHEVTKVSLLSCFPPALRPRCSKNVTTYRFSTRLRPRSPKCRAPSKLPKWRYLHVPLPSCALEVTKVSLLIVFLCVPQP